MSRKLSHIGTLKLLEAPSRCRFAPCGDTPSGGAGRSRCKSKRAVAAPRNGLLVVRRDAGVEAGAEHFCWFPCLAENPGRVRLRRCLFGGQSAVSLPHGRRLSFSASQDSAYPMPHPRERRSAPASRGSCALGLFPAQRLAQLPRQLPTAAVGMLSNELSQESNLFTVDRLPAIAPRFRFRHYRRMPEMKAERQPFVGGCLNLLFATPARLLFPGCPPPTAPAPDAPGAHGRALCRSATTRIVPATAFSAPARTLGRHRPGYGSRSRDGSGIQTGIPRRDLP